MKNTYLAVTIVFAVILLVAAFENSFSCTISTLFGLNLRLSSSLFLLFIGALGAFAGGFFVLWFNKFVNNSDEDEETDEF